MLAGLGWAGLGSAPLPVVMAGATNRPQELDEAARRRFVKRLYIPLPDEEARRQLVWRLLSANSHSIVEADVGKIVRATAGALPFGGCPVPTRLLPYVFVSPPRPMLPRRGWSPVFPFPRLLWR